MQPVIHITDLFHPHEDPDDHWDIACQYALAYLNKIDLKGIVIDYPVDESYGDPAIQAISQLNQIANLLVPFGIGSKEARKKRPTPHEDDIFRHNTGVSLILNALEASTEPIVIQVVGSCRDIVAAIGLRPDLFQQRCRGIYLNAGASKLESPPEYNVNLDPISYKCLFDAPCPLYWMPCFEIAIFPFEKGEFSSFYQFRQGDVLAELSQQMQNYFIYALQRSDQPWFKFLTRDVSSVDLTEISALSRNMWCTAGILHAAGLTVLKNGEIVPADDQKASEAVFSFPGIETDCRENGQVFWTMKDPPTNRFIFRVTDQAHYEKAMTAAMANLLRLLP